MTLTDTPTRSRPGRRLRAPTAAEVMSTPVLTVAPDESLWSAWNRLLRTGLRHLVVAVEGSCVGLLDERSILMTWPTWPVHPADRRVADVMRHPVHCVLPSTPVDVVAELMITQRVQAVPVVDSGENMQLVGIVTVTDLLRLVSHRDDA